MTQQTRLAIQSMAQTIHLQTLGLEGIPDSSINLTSPDGKWMLKVPRKAFEGITLSPGEMAVVSLTLTRVAVEPVPEPLGDFGGGKLILPGKSH